MIISHRKKACMTDLDDITTEDIIEELGRRHPEGLVLSRIVVDKIGEDGWIQVFKQGHGVTCIGLCHRAIRGIDAEIDCLMIEQDDD